MYISTWDSPSRDGRERELELEVESCSLAGTGWNSEAAFRHQ
jgi:hypothetical protein